IAAARASDRVGRVLVSTDDPEIRAVALAYGAEAPFLRPAALATDDARDLPVFLHALDWLEREEGYRCTSVVHLRPTSPLRPRGLVQAATERLRDQREADSVRTVCPPAQSPYKMWRARGELLEPLLDDAGPEAYNQPRQALPPTLWQTGHVDVVRREVLREGHSMTGTRIAPLIVDPAWAIDIDALVQWEQAEALLESGELAVDRPVPASDARVTPG